MTSHTPGPWSLCVDATSKGRLLVRTDPIHSYAFSVKDEANARLIASAPELLAALESAVKYLEAHRPKGKIRDIFSELNEYENGIMTPARLAIAKAGGEK